MSPENVVHTVGKASVNTFCHIVLREQGNPPNTRNYVIKTPQENMYMYVLTFEPRSSERANKSEFAPSFSSACS